jgi:hypothetical protein
MDNPNMLLQQPIETNRSGGEPDNDAGSAREWQCFFDKNEDGQAGDPNEIHYAANEQQRHRRPTAA